MTQTELWSLEEKRDLDVQTALGRRWILSAPLDCAFVLAWRQGASGFDLELLHADQALEALLDASKTFGPFDRRLGVRDARALQQVTRRLPVYRVTGAVDPTRLATSVATGRWRQLIA